MSLPGFGLISYVTNFWTRAIWRS